MARALSRPLTPIATGADRGAEADRPAGVAAGRWAGVGGAEAGTGVGARTVAVGAAEDAGAAAGAAAAAWAVGAGAGILMVGAALGFGGKLIRTVSFFGCTFAASVGLGGTAPDGVFGMFSAINVFQAKTRVGASWCQMLIRDQTNERQMKTDRQTPARCFSILKTAVSIARDDRHRGPRENLRRHLRRHRPPHRRPNEAVALHEAARC